MFQLIVLTLDGIKHYAVRNHGIICGYGVTVATSDLKSDACMSVSVRVRLSALKEEK